ncbi:zinc finger BED domain-containing protein RICESLEEPER 2 [Tanacetum coccineum]
MDQQTPQQNNPYESISSSIPTFDSFSSQQNMTIEDETIDVETLGNEDKKRKRKAPTRKPKAECWKYFDQKFENDEDGVLIKMAYCKWRPAVFKDDSQRHGTRHLNNHYPNCESNPDVEKLKKQKKLAFKKSIGEKDEGGTSSGTLETWKYDEKVIKESLIRLIVLAELPFKFVEHPAFIKFSSDMQPRFNMPSRFKIVRDVSKFYLEERKSLFSFLSKDSTTVHLTTDTWTSSCKRMNFMVLTAHFIDDFNNSCFARDLEETPKRADFEVCRKVVQFLEKFKETTELVSNVSSPVAHLWFGEVLDIDKHLREWQANGSFKNMIGDMRKKYDKYWGDYKKINHYMYFAVILDPTMKSEIVKYGFKHLIENGCMPMDQDEEDSQETPFQFLTPDELCDKCVEKVEKDMGLLFAMYKEKYSTTTSSDLPRPMSSKSGSSKSRRGNAFLNSFKDKLGNKSSGGEDELRKYLKEPRLELEDDEDFDILTWWKLNSPRFPIVSRMAKAAAAVLFFAAVTAAAVFFLLLFIVV